MAADVLAEFSDAGLLGSATKLVPANNDMVDNGMITFSV
jgi:hypothetical protein